MPFSITTRIKRRNTVSKICKGHRKPRKYCSSLQLCIHCHSLCLLLNVWLCFLKWWLYRFYFYINVCMCICLTYANMCARECMWRSKNSLRDSIPFFHPVGPKDQSQVISFGGKCFYPR